jgi:uncharacterized repeat protein (TIGR02543 family)
VDGETVKTVNIVIPEGQTETLLPADAVPTDPVIESVANVGSDPQSTSQILGWIDTKDETKTIYTTDESLAQTEGYVPIGSFVVSGDTTFEAVTPENLVIPAPEPESIDNPIQENNDWIAGQARNDGDDADTPFSEKVGSPAPNSAVQPPRQSLTDTPPQEGNDDLELGALGGDDIGALSSPSDGYVDVGDRLQVNPEGIIVAFNDAGLSNKNIFIPKQAVSTDGGAPIDIKGIYQGVFSVKALTGIEFDEDSEILSIGNNAFMNNPSMVIKNGFVPKKLESIGVSAFDNTGITQINLPSTLKVIGQNAFANAKLTSLSVPGSVKQIPTGILYGTPVINVVLGEGVETIAGNGFFGNSALQTINIPSSIVSVASGASFYSVHATIDISWATPSQFPKLGAGFYGGKNTIIWNSTGTDPDSYFWIDAAGVIGGLKPEGSVPEATYPIGADGKLTIPKEINGVTVTRIADGVLGGFSTLKELDFAEPSQITEIGEQTFMGSPNLTKVKLPSSLERLGNMLFYGDGKISGEIIIPDSVTRIETQAFYGSAVSSIKFGNSSAITFIGANAFYGNSISDIYLQGEDKDSIDNAPWGAQYATVHWAEDKTTDPIVLNSSDGLWQYKADGTIVSYVGPTGASVDVVIPATLSTSGGAVTTIQNIGDGATRVLTSATIKSLKISEGIKIISASAFQGTTIADGTLVIPASVTIIGGSAFTTTGLNSLTFAEGSMLNSINSNAAFGNNNLTKVTLPESLKVLGAFTFQNNNLTGEVVIPSNVIDAPNSVFLNNNGITKITVNQVRSKANIKVTANAPWGAPAGIPVVYKPMESGSGATFTQIKTEDDVTNGGLGTKGQIFYTANIPFGEFVDYILLPNDNKIQVASNEAAEYTGYLTNYYSAAPYEVNKNGTYTFTLHTLAGDDVVLNYEVEAFGTMKIDADSEITLAVGGSSAHNTTWAKTATEAEIIDYLWAAERAVATDLDSGTKSNSGNVNPRLSISPEDIAKFHAYGTTGAEGDEGITITLNAAFSPANGEADYTASKDIKVIADGKISATFSIREGDELIGKFDTLSETTVVKQYATSATNLPNADIPVAVVKSVAGAKFVGWYRGSTKYDDNTALLTAIGGKAVGDNSYTYEARFIVDTDDDGKDDRTQGKTRFIIDTSKGTFLYGGEEKSSGFTIKGDANTGLLSVSATSKSADREFAGWRIGDGMALNGKSGYAENQLKFVPDTVARPVDYTAVFSDLIKFTWLDGSVASFTGNKQGFVVEGSSYFDDGFVVPTLTTTAAYSFLGWSKTGLAPYTDASVISTAEVTEPTEYKADFSENEAFSVRYDPGTGGTLGSATSKSNIKWSAAFLVPTAAGEIPTREGYTLSGWTTASDYPVDVATQYKEIGSENSTTEIVLTAQWTANTDTAYKVEHYKVNSSGTAVKVSADTENKTGETDTTGTSTPKSYDGYTYQASYNANGNTTVASADITGDGNLVLKLYYTANTNTAYTVEHYKVNSSGVAVKVEADTENKTGETDTTGTSTPKSYDGYTYQASYNVNGNITVASADITGDGNLVLKLYYTANTNTAYKVEHYKVNSSGVAVQVEADTENKTGETDTLGTSTPKSYSGYTHAASYNEESNIAKETGNIDGDGSLVLKLYYTANLHNISFNANSGKGTMPALPIYFDETKTLIDNAFTKAGYTFAGWATSKDGSVAYADKASYKLAADSDIPLYAVWNANGNTAYKVEHYHVDALGSASLKETSNHTAKTDTTANATAKTYEHYTLNSAHGSAVASGNVSGDGSLVLKLYYGINHNTVSYSVTGTVPEGAPAAPAASDVAYGQTVNVASALAFEGYTFSGWTADGVSGASFTMPDSAVAFTGSWTLVDNGGGGDNGGGTGGQNDGNGGGNNNNGNTVVDEPKGPDTGTRVTTRSTGNGTTTPIVNNNTTAARPSAVQAAHEQGISTFSVGGLEVPLTPPAGYVYWSLLDFIFVILGLFVAGQKSVSAAVLSNHYRGQYGEEKKAIAKPAFLIATIAFAVGSLVLFLVTQDITKQMVLVDWQTTIFTVLFAAEMVAAQVSSRVSARTSEV